MKLTLYLLFGSAFILVGILALYVGAGQRSFSFLTMAAQQFDPTAAIVGVPRLLRRIRHPRRHLAVAHVVARRTRVGAHRRVDAACGRAHEARRVWRGPAGHGAAARGDRRVGVARRHDRLHQHRLRRAQRDGADAT